MSQQPARGISRQGLDAAFEAEEARKSRLILEARLLREQQQDEGAADRFAQAAEIEERLSDICEAKNLVEKALVLSPPSSPVTEELPSGAENRSLSKGSSRECCSRRSCGAS